jgi:long-chain fatty acid transport protein
MGAVVFLAVTPGLHAQLGVVLSGAGPVNRSMAGASTAAPLDATGALYWNPATIGGLCPSEVELGVEFLMPRVRLGSSVPANAFGPGVPPVPLAGSTKSDNGVAPIPTMGFVWRPEGSSVTFGAGLLLVGGFNVNYPASVTNPVLTGQPPGGIGLGPLSADLQVFQFVPTVAWEIADGLHLGVAPTINLVRLTADPFFLVSPDDANGDGFARYPAGTHTRFIWGAGFQVGLWYADESGLAVGVSFKSPQWLESFHFQSADERGQPRPLRFHFDYPMMVSLGVAYRGVEHWTFAADVRYIDYRNTAGFDETGFDRTGAVRGLGWDSVFALALGTQYQATESLSLRLGYSYNTNPIDDEQTMFNVASPLILQHTVYLGASFALTDSLLVSAAYAHAFQNAVQGAFLTPLGAIPGSAVRSDLSADSVMVGVSVKF